MARCSSYTAGNCTRGACLAEGWIPEGLGNAVQWPERARAKGFDVTDIPTVNAVAVWVDANRYNWPLGHCGIVMAVASYTRYKVLEMNFTAFNQYDERWTDRVGLLGFILPPGTAPGTGASGPPAPLPPPLDLEHAWSDLTAVWNYVIDAEVIGLHNIATALDQVN